MTTDPGARRATRYRARLRILGWCLVPVAIAEVASVVVLHRLLHAQVDDRTVASLEQEVAELRSLVSGSTDEPGSIDATDPRAVFDAFLRRNIPSENEAMLTFVDGVPYNATSGLPASVLDDEALTERWAATVETTSGRLTTTEGPTMFLAVPLRQEGETTGVFVVLDFLRSEQAEVDDTIRTLALVSAAVFLLSGLVAWFASGRVLAPVRSMTDTARSITETDITRRLTVDGDDEIAELGHTFNAMLDRLDAAFTTQRAFIDDASHELRTPITIIRGHLELMGDDPEERREVVEIVTDELDRMSRMVDDMLLLAKAERPGFLVLDDMDLAATTLDWAQRAGALAPRDWVVEDLGRTVLLADRQRLTQAVMNLASNAANHTDDGAPIRIGSSVVDGEARIWISDSGPGIAPEEAEKIFRRFGQGSARRTRGESTGLGLAIVRAIVDAHGGRVELDSEPGHGATFTLVIPIRTEGTPESWRAS